MHLSRRPVFFTLLLVTLTLALIGGTWSAGLSAGLPQSTLPTAIPTREPRDTPTPVPPARPPARPTGPVPLIFIITVNPDETVTIRTANFPVNVDFDVLMNYYGTLGIGGEKVDVVNSGAGGVLSWTFKIPAFLKGQTRIAIRLQSAKGHFAYNWFWNLTGGGISVHRGFTIPTFRIVTVECDKTVTIETLNFPAHDTFDVLMNRYGTLGIGGVKVTQVDSKEGGVLTWTFEIPDSLKGQERIAIRLQSPSSGYFAYNWFWNNSTSCGASNPAPGGAPSGIPSGLTPTITITKVIKNDTVTIRTAGFPANDTFKVTMNTYGTRGVGGTLIGEVKSDAGGVLTFTFQIPDSMKGKDRIAIRLESPGSGYYAFNWFWNSTWP